MNQIFKVKAPAKINLYLDVLGLRKDGYHNLLTVYQSIRLSDELFFTLKEKDIEIKCDNKDIPSDEKNLVYKSAKLFFDFAKIKKGIKIEIKKKIPTQAGLGGGSSDAAVTLFALNKLFNADIPLFKLSEMGANIGTDVPFFLTGGTALGIERGELVFPLPDISPLFLVLGYPEVGISTKEAYKKIDRVLTEYFSSLKIGRIVRKILTGEFGKEDMFNRFEEVIEDKKILAYRDKLLKSGAEKVLLCGSGSSYFGVYGDSSKAKDAFRRLSVQGSWAVSSTLRRRDFFNFISPTTLKKESIK